MRGLLLLAVVATGCATSHRTRGEVHTFVRHYNNAHVILGSDGYVMVDAGLESDGPTLARDLERRGLDPKRLEAIVLTHAHADHAGGARFFQQTYGTRVVVGQGDAAMLARGSNDTLCPTDATARRRVEDDQATRFTPTDADVIVDDTLDLRTVSSAAGTVFALPGHTEGSLVIVSGRHAFVGDLFRGSIVGRKAERHFYMCDLEDNDADIRMLLEGPASTVSTFFTGHFGPLDRSAVERRFTTEE
jgi:glyoxylase-like metal-dependent hydrolase (beta-lactamase superfamily II)